jgi:hypothetical protein
LLARVRSGKIRSSFIAFALSVALLLAAQTALWAQAQTASGGSTNQTNLNSLPTLSMPGQGSQMTAHERSERAGRTNQVRSGKPSPVKQESAARANLSTVGSGGYSNVLQPFLGGADWAGSLLPPLAPQANIRPPWAGGHLGRDDYVLAVPVYVPSAPGAYDDNGGGEGNPGFSSEEAQFSDAEDMNDEGMPEDASAQIAPEVDRDPVVVQPATVIVFKDGHRADVVNYAIVGDTLFDFGDGLTRKFQLTTIDLAATQKANEAIGVEFKLPPVSAR